MKISQTLPQFENYPALFVVSGEFEAVLFVAKGGAVTEYPRLEMNPREEAMEKQAFMNKSGGTGAGAVSHHERYMEDLKTKFQKKLAEVINVITSEEKIAEICIIAPGYAANSLKKSLHRKDQELVHLTIHGLHTRKNIKKILELYQKELAQANHYIIQAQQEYAQKSSQHAIIQ